MKSFQQPIFVSGDGDGIGGVVEQKVMANDLEGLIQQSVRIKKGQRILKAAFEDLLCGETLVHGGDDNLFRIEARHLNKIEKIRAAYEKLTGFTVTLGIGTKMSEAVKAMVYGKLTGKNKTVYWEPGLETKLKSLAHEQTEAEKQSQHGLLKHDRRG